MWIGLRGELFSHKDQEKQKMTFPTNLKLQLRTPTSTPGLLTPIP